MKNLKLGVFTAVTALLAFSSCIEHEVIPAPVPMVDLSCHFIGTVNSTTMELTENVDNYSGTATKSLIILPAPSYSSASYNFEMNSTTNAKYVRVSLGSVFWDASISSEPSLTVFNNFHTSNLTPVFSNAAASGFEVAYRDASGVVWTSHDNSVNFQDVTFSSIKQESDTSGDYSKFVCNFDCYVYHQDAVTLLWDSLPIQSAEMTGWFKR